MNYSDKLRALAAYLDSHPTVAENITEWENPSLYIHANDKEDFSAIVRSMGNARKAGNYGTVTATHVVKDGPGKYDPTAYSVTVALSGACERVPVLNEDGTPKVKPVVRTVETDEMEPVTEWHCPESFLNL